VSITRNDSSIRKALLVANPINTFMCPLCGDVVESTRNTRIPYATESQQYELRLNACQNCMPHVQLAFDASFARTSLSFHPQLMHCLRTTITNRDPDPVKAAVDMFVAILEQHEN
jgi:predicted RNA-binding Zn-ribbon protein involved in translation (DUF1610 family)